LGLFGGPALVQEGRPDDSRQWWVSRPLLWLLCGDISFVYPAMSMVVIGPSLLY
jgi:hypothetical protein